jgi:excisionase family DNA binding protein
MTIAAAERGQSPERTMSSEPRAESRKPEDLSPLLLTVDEAAQLIRISRSKLYELLQRREIPSIAIGRSRRIPAEGLRNWVTAQASASGQYI